MDRPRKWAVITGASSGIGRAFAFELSARGYSVLLVARRADALDRVRQQIADRGGTAESVVADLATRAGIEAVHRAVSIRSGVELLVNNAGIGSYSPFLEQPPGAASAQVALNINAVLELTRGLLPAMVARGRGQIINVASILSFMPTPYFATYAATKSFLLSFSEALSYELRGTGVRVLASCPGVTETGFANAADWPDTKSLPHLRPEDVARISLDAADAGRSVRVIGAAYRLLAFLLAVMPRFLMRPIIGRIFKPAVPQLASKTSRSES